MSVMQGYLGGCLLALAASIGLGAPALAQDDANLALGREAWLRSGCAQCHGSRAGGGLDGDNPVGPGLRNTLLDKETMAMIVSCGLPGTPMPAWLKGAYTEVECYGEPVGSRPALGVTLPAILSADEINALIDYIYATFVQTPQP